MNYAVIRSGGKQYKISVGDILKLDKLNSETGKNLVFEDVLLLVNEGKATIGKPVVSGAIVEARLIENVKGDKIRISKFKAKSRYRKTTGFRSKLSVVQIEKIELGGKKVTEKSVRTSKTAPRQAKKV